MLLRLLLAILLVMTITAVSPNHGKQGDVIKVSAAGFARARVFVGKNLCGTLRQTQTEIYCIVPPGLGTVDVSVYSYKVEQPVTLKNAFTYDQ